MKNLWTFTRGALLGAGLMYIMDPSRGGRRRARVRDKGSRAWRRSALFMGKAGRDLRNRARGGFAEAVSQLKTGEASDWVVEERVRAKLGRLITHPHAVDVKSVGGSVTLSGPILRHETGSLITALQSIPGVVDVVNRLEEHETGAHIPALQGRPRRVEGPVWTSWPPSLQLFAAAAGAVAVAYGAQRAIARTRAGGDEGPTAPNYAYLR
jgi:hypothetical protein